MAFVCVTVVKSDCFNLGRGMRVGSSGSRLRGRGSSVILMGWFWRVSSSCL